MSVLLSCFCTEIQDQCEKAADSSDAEYDDDFEEYDSSEVSTPTPIKTHGAPFYPLRIRASFPCSVVGDYF